MSAHAIDGILFDIDDTLVDTRGAFGTALATIARQYLPDVPPDRDGEILTFWRADANGHFAAVHARRGERARAADVPGQRAARAVRRSRPGRRRLRGVGRRVRRELPRAWSAHDDVDAVLDRLLAAGLHVGALTNAAFAYQTDKLDRAGLADRVPLLVAVDTLGFGKPDPRVFAEACRLLGTDPGARPTSATSSTWTRPPPGGRAWSASGSTARAPAACRSATTRSPPRGAVIASLAELPAALGL